MPTVRTFSLKLSLLRFLPPHLGFPHSSVDKESACNTGDPGSISRSGRSAEKRVGSTPVFLGFPGGSAGKESVCNAGDLGSIPGLGRSSGEGKGYPLQSIFRPGEFHGHRVYGVAKSQIQLSEFHFHFHLPVSPDLRFLVSKTGREWNFSVYAAEFVALCYRNSRKRTPALPLNALSKYKWTKYAK